MSSTDSMISPFQLFSSKNSEVLPRVYWIIKQQNGRIKVWRQQGWGWLGDRTWTRDWHPSIPSFLSFVIDLRNQQESENPSQRGCHQYGGPLSENIDLISIISLSLSLFVRDPWALLWRCHSQSFPATEGCLPDTLLAFLCLTDRRINCSTPAASIPVCLKRLEHFISSSQLLIPLESKIIS